MATFTLLLRKRKNKKQTNKQQPSLVLETDFQSQAVFHLSAQEALDSATSGGGLCARK